MASEAWWPLPIERYSEMLDDYANGLNWAPTDLEKALLALGQLLLGHDHFGARLPNSNAVLLARVAYGGVRRAIAVSGGSRPLGIDPIAGETV